MALRVGVDRFGLLGHGLALLLVHLVKASLRLLQQMGSLINVLLGFHDPLLTQLLVIGQLAKLFNLRVVPLRHFCVDDGV